MVNMADNTPPIRVNNAFLLTSITLLLKRKPAEKVSITFIIAI